MVKLLPLILLFGCTLHVGIGNQFSIDEDVMENPIGIVRLHGQDAMHANHLQGLGHIST